MAPIATLFVDYRSPFSYLIIDEVLAFATETGAEIAWRPYRVSLEEAHGRSVEMRSERDWRKLRYLYADVRRIANRRNPPLTVRGTVRIFDPTLAHIGMLVAQDTSHDVFLAYHGDVQRRLWTRALDLEDRAALRAILVSAGGDGNAYDHAVDNGGGIRRLDEIARSADASGVFGVPTLRIEKTGELFWGVDRMWLFRETALGLLAERSSVDAPNGHTA